MKILVTAKRVVDPYVKIRFSTDDSLMVNDLKHSVNPFDEVAIEEALRMKSKGLASEVIAVSIGSAIVEESLRAALAVDVDRAILIVTEVAPEPLLVARILSYVCDREEIQLVILGKQGIDGDCGQVGPMIAGLKSWSQATAATKIELEHQNLSVTCEGDTGVVLVQCNLPAVVTVDLRLNTPRYAGLPGIIRARKKPIEVIRLDELPIDLSVHSRLVKIREPETRSSKCHMASSASDLAQFLKNKEKVI